jgi:hypothetical protein
MLAQPFKKRRVNSNPGVISALSDYLFLDVVMPFLELADLSKCLRSSKQSQSFVGAHIDWHLLLERAVPSAGKLAQTREDARRML